MDLIRIQNDSQCRICINKLINHFISVMALTSEQHASMLSLTFYLAPAWKMLIYSLPLSELQFSFLYFHPSQSVPEHKLWFSKLISLIQTLIVFWLRCF